MTVDEVKDLLGHLAGNRGRAARLEVEITKLEREARQLRQMEVTTLKASTVDGMPRRKGGKSDPTAHKAVQLASGEAVSAAEARLMEKISGKKADLEQLRLDVQLAEGWLNALMEREKLVISLQLVQKRSWREVAAEYARAFGDDMSEDTLRRMRDRTCEFIARQM